MRAPQQEKRRVLTTTLLENSYEEEDFKCEKIMQCELSAISFFFSMQYLEERITSGQKQWNHGTSLVVQWLRIHLIMQETQVQSLIWEDPTSCEAAKPVSQLESQCTTEIPHDALKILCATTKI